MKRRLMGEELEFGLAGVSNTELDAFILRFVRLAEIIKPKCCFRDLGDDLINRPIWWFANGGKFYKDTGEHPEYATPECLSVKDLVAHDKASEEILRKIGCLCPENERPNFAVIKNNICYYTGSNHDLSRGFSWGLHENYLTPIEITSKLVAEELAPHLIARIIYTGAGHIFPFRKKFSYVLSSRASFITTIWGNTATSSKPMILERPEPHADINKWNRIQIVSGEANMLELPIYLRFMTNHLCLRLLEEGWRLPAGFELEKPIEQLWSLNYDIYLEKSLQLLNGLHRKAIDVERLYLDVAKKLNPLSEEERKGLELWEWVLDLLSCDLRKDGNLRKLVGVLDWPTKWYLIKKEIESKNWSLSHPKILGLNVCYHSLDSSPQKSLWAHLIAKDKENLFMFHIVSEEDIKLALSEPPIGRAQIRSDLIKLAVMFPGKVNLYHVDWGEANLFVEKYKDIVKIDFGISNPFAESSELVEFLKQRFLNAPNPI